MSNLETFVCGCVGSIAVEIVKLQQCLDENRKLPERYSWPIFWVIRTFMVGLSGALAVAYNIDSMLLAANIGAATPLIINSFAQGIKDFAAGQVLPNKAPEQNDVIK